MILLWVQELFFLFGSTRMILVQIAYHVDRQRRHQRLRLARVDR